MSDDQDRHAATTIEECAMLKCVAAFFEANDIRGLLKRRGRFREIVGEATGLSGRAVGKVLSGQREKQLAATAADAAPGSGSKKRKRRGTRTLEQRAMEVGEEGFDIIDACRDITAVANKRHPPQPVYCEYIRDQLYKDHPEEMKQLGQLFQAGQKPTARGFRKPGASLPVDTLRNALTRAGFAFDQADTMNVLAEKKTSVKYRNQYLAKVIEGRVGDTPAAVQPSALPPPQLGADGEDGETVQEGLTKSPAKLAFKLGKKIKKPKRSRGRGWKMNYAVLDESYVCVNHVARKTLYDKASGEKVHRLEGAGKRVCMAGCGIYWGNSGNNEPLQAEWVGEKNGEHIGIGFVQFPAKGGGSKTQSKVSAHNLKGVIRSIKGGKLSKPVTNGAGKKVSKPMNRAELEVEFRRVSVIVEGDTSQWKDMAVCLDWGPKMNEMLKSLKSEGEMEKSTDAAGTVDNFDYHGNFDNVRFVVGCCCCSDCCSD
jgi:hypothetical protein